MTVGHEQQADEQIAVQTPEREAQDFVQVAALTLQVLLRQPQPGTDKRGRFLNFPGLLRDPHIWQVPGTLAHQIWHVQEDL